MIPVTPILRFREDFKKTHRPKQSKNVPTPKNKNTKNITVTNTE